MNAQLTRRERKKQETRQRLMKEALALFLTHGYEHTTVEKIAEAADVAKGTFFNYFDTKDTILPAMVEWQLQELEENLIEQEITASPIARIKRALGLIIETPLIAPDLAGPLFKALNRPNNHGPRLTMAITRLLSDLVREAQAAGEIRTDVDPVHIGGIIRTLLFHQMAAWGCGYTSTPLVETIETTIDLLLEGIAGPKWRQQA